MNYPVKILFVDLRNVFLFLAKIFERYHIKIEHLHARSRATKSYNTIGTLGKTSLLELLTTMPTIIEIGAHEGGDTMEFSLLFPKGRIYSFEASPKLFAMLYRRCYKLRNVTLVNAALSDRNGVSHFHQSSGVYNASGSLLPPTEHLVRHPDVHFEPEDMVIVPTITLSEYFNITALKYVDLIWVDVQGAEKLVLEGGFEILKITKFIYAEVSEISLYEGGTNYSELKLFLEKLGFITYQEFLPPEWMGEGNVLFLNTKFN